MVNRNAQKDLAVSCLGNSTIESLLGDTVVLYESVFRGDKGNLVWNLAFCGRYLCGNGIFTPVNLNVYTS